MVNEKALRPLVDTDILRYRCGFAADSQARKEAKQAYPELNDEEIEQCLLNSDYLGHALNNVKTVMEAMLERFSPNYIAYVQGKGNFRDSLATLKPYKGNRDNLHKPKYYQEIKAYLMDRWNAIEVHDQESDDAIGIEQYKHPDRSTVIVSTDKDMMCIPGWHYNWVKGELINQSLDGANMFHLWQLMVGDPTDNIPGVYKVGPKTADKIIASCDNDLEKVKQEIYKMYQKQYGDTWKEALQECSDLLWIRREPNKGCDFLGI